MALPQPVQESFSELRQIGESAKPFWSYILIDEQAFFIATSKLKNNLPPELRLMAMASREAGRSVDSIEQIDKLEMLVEKGSGHIFGKVFIEKEVYRQQLTGIGVALATDIPRAHEQSPLNPSLSHDNIQAAQAEANRIIEEAKREAERIVEEARRRSESPWSG